MNRMQKSFEMFRGLFDFSAGALRSGFYPVPVAGMAAPPVNMAGTSSGTVITPKQSMEMSAFWGCVWLISNTIASLPFVLNRKNGLNSWGNPATDEPLYTVLGAQPNTLMTAVNFWRFIVASDLVWGSGYALKTLNGAGQCIALSTLLPQFMAPYKQNGTNALRYMYRPGNGQGEQDFSADQIFHYKSRTLDGLTGVSVIEYARNSLGIAKAAETATADTFRNGMRANGFLMVDQVLKKEQRDQIRGTLETFKAGGPDSAGFMVLEAGMTFEALTMNPQDAQLIAQRVFAVEDLCRWFGVPPVLVGHAAAGVTSWGTGIEQLLLGFLSLTLRPMIRGLEQQVSMSLIQPADRTALYLTIDTDDLLGADSTARSTLYSTYAQNGVMTRNEIRAKEDMPPMDGGDVLTCQVNLTPLDKLGQTPPAAGAGGTADKPVAKPESDTPPAEDPAAAAEKAFRRSLRKSERQRQRARDREDLITACAQASRKSVEDMLAEYATRAQAPRKAAPLRVLDPKTNKPRRLVIEN